MYRLSVLIAIIFFSAFNIFAQKIDRHFSDPFPETNDTNALNFDNKIFTTNRVFNYSYIVKNKKDSILGKYALIPFWKITEKKDTVMDYRVSVVGENQPVNDSATVIDKFCLIVCRSSLNTRLAQEQTIAKYKYLSGKDTLNTLVEMTGVAEDSTFVFLHPPRQKPFTMLELCPFPQVNYPLKVGKNWTNNLFIPIGFAKDLGYATNSSLILKNEFTIINKINLGKTECYVIEARAIEDRGLFTTKSKFYFNESLGFVKVEYDLVDGNRIIFDLEHK